MRFLRSPRAAVVPLAAAAAGAALLVAGPAFAADDLPRPAADVVAQPTSVVPTPPPPTTTPIVPTPAVPTTTPVAPTPVVPTGVVPDGPSLVQLCTATSVAAVDDLLGEVAESELVGGLAPLLDLTVPAGGSVELDAAVDLDDVRDALDCAVATVTDAPTTTPVAPPTTSAAPVDTDAPTTTTTETPTTTLPAGDGGQQIRTFPRGGVDTGGA